jgi:glycine cleavage system H protein
MTNVPSELFYTKDHEWIKEEPDGTCLVGITHHAQDSLGDVTFVEMPTIGQSFDRGSVFGVVESVKVNLQREFHLRNFLIQEATIS